jgi:hypothetical protein
MKATGPPADGRRTLECPGADDGEKRNVRREPKRQTPIHEWSGVLVVETGSVRVCLAECPSRREVADQLRECPVVTLIEHHVARSTRSAVQNNITPR